MLMQAFLRGFWRVKQNKALGGLGRISGTGFLGCFFFRPSSWCEEGSMTSLAHLLSFVPPVHGPLLPVSPMPPLWGLGLTEPVLLRQSGREWGWEDYFLCSQRVKLARAAQPKLLRPGSCHSFLLVQPVTSQTAPKEGKDWV